MSHHITVNIHLRTFFYCSIMPTEIENAKHELQGIFICFRALFRDVVVVPYYRIMYNRVSLKKTFGID